MKKITHFQACNAGYWPYVLPDGQLYSLALRPEVLLFDRNVTFNHDQNRDYISINFPQETLSHGSLAQMALDMLSLHIGVLVQPYKDNLLIELEEYSDFSRDTQLSVSQVAAFMIAYCFSCFQLACVGQKCKIDLAYDLGRDLYLDLRHVLARHRLEPVSTNMPQPIRPVLMREPMF